VAATRPKPRSSASYSEREGHRYNVASLWAHREKLPETHRGLSLFSAAVGPRALAWVRASSSLFAAWAAVAPADLDSRIGWGVLGPCCFCCSQGRTRPSRQGGVGPSLVRLQIIAVCRGGTTWRLGGRTAASGTDKRPGPCAWKTPTHSWPAPLPVSIARGRPDFLS